jgi:Ubiquitin-like autophagy protein Apg12
MTPTNEFLYVNSSFAPGLDETVGNLYQVFSSGGVDTVFQYSGGVDC